MTEGYARVYLDPEPERGAHPGLRGPITTDEMGVHVEDDCEWLLVVDDGTAWPMGTWDLVDGPTTVPWHRVHQIEWKPND